MYISSDVVDRIKSRAKIKHISTTKMLEECGLSKNTLCSMSTRGSWIQANNLAKIADELNCSVDYLLGRTEDPDSVTEKQLSDIIRIYNQLDEVGKAKLLIAADNILKGE